MNEQSTVTETMKISDIRSNINTLVNEVYRHEKRFIVEKSGIPVAAIVSMNDLKRLDELAQKQVVLDRVIAEMQAAFANVPPEELERIAERTLSEVRQERRSERHRAAL